MLVSNMFSWMRLLPPLLLVVRSSGPRFEEPPGYLEARAELFNCSTPEARSFWSKQLYRRKRKWLNYVARRRFDLDGSRLPRSDRLSRSRTRALCDAVGEPCYDVTQWGDIVEPCFRNLFSSTLETFPEKRLRLATLESTCFAAQLDGTHKALHLPFSVEHELRLRMLPGKQGGSDGLVGEMLKLIDWLALGRIRFAFEQSNRDSIVRVDTVTPWLIGIRSILVHCIPKTHTACHLKLYRPISLVSCMAKWYLSCLVFMLRSHTWPHMLDLWLRTRSSVRRGDGAFRMLLQKCEEWSLPLFYWPWRHRRSFRPC